MRQRKRNDRVRKADESGFSVVELVIAMGVFALVAAMLSHMLAAGMSGVLLGKRREVATQEANRVLEIARALSYDAIGLIQSDPTVVTDTANITTQEGKKSFRPDTVWEPLIWAPNATNHPFNPHIQNVSRAATDLTDSIYVTGVDDDDDGEIDMKRVTVRVSWADQGAAVNEVRASTLINAAGLVPCQQPCDGTEDDLTPLTATTFASGGAVTVDSSLLGLSVPLSVTLPTSKGSSTFRLVSDATCSTHSMTMNATDLVSVPGYSVSTTADNDAATQTSADPDEATNSGVLAIPSGPAANLLGSVINSPIACDAEADPLPMEDGSASALSALNAQTSVVALGGLLNWLLTLANVTALPVEQDIAQEVVSDQREVAASTTNAVGTVQLLKIPGVIGSGLVQLDGLTYGASVRAAAGTPSAAPAVTSPSFVLRVFDNGNKLGASCASATGTGISAAKSGSYCNVTVTPSTAGFSGKTFTLTHNFTQLLGLNLVNLSYTTTVSILPTAKSGANGVTGPNGERRWSAEYQPVSISTSLHSDVLGVDIIDADVDFNLGKVSANACAGATC